MRVKPRVRMVRRNSHKSLVKINDSRIKPKLWKGVKRMSVVADKPVIIAPMARMKQMAQEAMKEKGLTGSDVRRMIGIKRYEQED